MGGEFSRVPTTFLHINRASVGVFNFHRQSQESRVHTRAKLDFERFLFPAKRTREQTRRVCGELLVCFVIFFFSLDYPCLKETYCS